MHGNDKIALKRIEELIKEYNVNTIIVGKPLNMDGSYSKRMEETEKFIHKLKCRFNTIKIDSVDERLTTVEAHKTMNLLGISKYKKRDIVDTISAVYILEKYMNAQNKN